MATLCFKVNFDQTYVALLAAASLTFNALGAKQVAAVGLEDKQAFTLMVAVLASAVSMCLSRHDISKYIINAGKSLPRGEGKKISV